MRLIHFIESGYFFETKGRIAVGTSETRDRFQQLVSWLCECIRQDPEPIMRGGKMLILWEPIGSVRLCMAQDLRAEILIQFPQMEIEVRQATEYMLRHWIQNQAYGILKDDDLLEEARETGVRYLIGIF